MSTDRYSMSLTRDDTGEDARRFTPEHAYDAQPLTTLTFEVDGVPVLTFRSAESFEMRAPGPTALDEMMRKANAYDDLRQVLIEARAEVDRWGHGDFHYGNSPRDKGVLAMLAKIDAALDEPGAGQTAGEVNDEHS